MHSCAWTLVWGFVLFCLNSEFIASAQTSGDVAHTIKQLEHEDVRVRLVAVQALMRKGPDAKTAVPALIRRLRDDDESVRVNAQRALAAIGKTAVPDLIIALKDDDPSVRQVIAFTLMRIGPGARDAVPALIVALKDDYKPVRLSSVVALGEIGADAKPAVPALVAALRDLNEQVRDAAQQALSSIGTGAVPELINALKHDDLMVRNSAALALVEIGKPAVPSLIATMADGDGLVRGYAIQALGRVGPDAKSAVPNLIAALKDDNEEIRRYAALALGRIGADAGPAVPDLTAALKDNNLRVAMSAAKALEGIGPGAGDAVFALILQLMSDNGSIRLGAIRALGAIGQGAADAVPAMIDRLADQDLSIREPAAVALGQIGRGAVVPLIRALRNKNVSVRRGAALSLALIGRDAVLAVPALVESLNDGDENVRRHAATALGKIGPSAKPAVYALAERLNDSDQFVQLNSVEALAAIGPGARDVVPDLIKALKDVGRWDRRMIPGALAAIGSDAKASIPALIGALKDGDSPVQQSAAAALAQIAEALTDKKDTSTIDDLQKAVATIKVVQFATLEAREEIMHRLSRAITAMENIERASWGDRLFERAIRNRWVIGIAVVLTAFFLWLLTLQFVLVPFFPLRVLAWNESLKPYADFKLPKELGELKVSVRYLILIGFFHHHYRVLDAWVERHVGAAHQDFTRGTTYLARKTYVSIPVVLDGIEISNFTTEALRATCNKDRWFVAVQGEGGVGKTTLACQIALWAMELDKAKRLVTDHRMIPVLIEPGLGFDVRKDIASFTHAIRGQLQALIGVADSVPEDLFARLLRTRRLLVILDGQSEMFSDPQVTASERVRPTHPEFPVAAFVITTRTEIRGATITIQPRRLDSDHLLPFMNAYLTQAGISALKDSELYRACGRLAEMMGMGRDITPLFARLYVEEMIAFLGEKKDLHDLPDTIPSLIVTYVNSINRDRVAGDPDNPLLHQVAKTAAWACLNQSYRPRSARKQDILETLADVAKAREVLIYLEARLRLIRTVSPDDVQIQFVLDPLAEYLAGLHVVEKYKGNSARWKSFLKKADSMPGAPETIKGFLLAVRDCCLAKSMELNIPVFVAEELAERAGLAEALARARIAPLVEALKNKAPEIRQSAVKQLAEKGRVAVSALLGPLDDDDVRVRQEAARSLMIIGQDAGVAVQGLIGALGDVDPEVRWMVALTLGKIGTPAAESKAALLKVLKKNAESRPRQEAAVALARIDAGQDVVSALVDALKDGDKTVAAAAARALAEIGTPASEALPDLIEAHEDSDPGLRDSAARALGKIGSATQEVLQALTKPLTRDGLDLAVCECYALGDLGPAAESAVPVLIGALECAHLCNAAATALGKIGRPAAVVVHALTALLVHRDRIVRRTAAEAIGIIGPAATEAIQHLIDVTNTDDDGLVRVQAANSLVAIGCDPEFSISALCVCLRHDDSSARKAAAENLGKLGPAAGTAVPALAAALKDEHWYVRAAVADSLGKTGSLAAGAVPELMAALLDDWQPTNTWPTMTCADGPIYDIVRYQAIVALGRIGLAASAAIPALQDAVKYQALLREAAENAVELIEEGTGDTIPN